MPETGRAEAKRAVSDPVVLPNRVYAIGGAGIMLARETFTNRSILRRILEPRNDRPRRLTLTLLDTAQSERETIENAKTAIESRRDEVEETLRKTETDTLGSLVVQTNDVLLQAGHNLTGPDVVADIADHYAMDPANWWLRPEDVDEGLDFTRGVYRRRAMAKAIYYETRMADRELQDMVDMAGNGQAVVLVGLGGGTGAGTSIDVAERLVRAAPASKVTLFGILPTPNEETRVGANAFATLSELEPVQLGDESLFRDVVLLLIAPVSYEGKCGIVIHGRSETSYCIHHHLEWII